MKVIYNDSEGNVAVLTPAPQCPRSIQEIANKDVPYGLPYKIVDDSVIPDSTIFRGAWEVETLQLTDGTGAESNEFLTEVGGDNY